MKTSSFIEKVLKRPAFIYSFLTLFVFLGIIGYGQIDRKLFPDSNRPEIAVVMIQPGSSAKDIASNVAVPSEKEFYSIDKVRRVYSNTIDEVSVVRVEFEYGKDLSEAANDIANSINKIKSSLPSDLLEPQIHKISAATPPVIVFGASSDKLSLQDIKEIAENEIKNALLTVGGVANVDIFGGYKKEVRVEIDKKLLDRYNLPMNAVINALKKNNKDYAIGFIDSKDSSYLVKNIGKRDSIKALLNLPISADIKLKDVAEVKFEHYKNSALYYGNGKKAIAISVQRGISADVVKTIENAEAKIEELAQKYPGITFETTDTQKEIIEQSISNMFESLRDAIIMSTLVVFLFLASFRQVLIVALTIPLVYATTIAIMWGIGMEFSVVGLTAIILALGLLLDDTVVVLENIERHYREEHDDIHKAVINGTKEIMFADFSGTITTMIALSPMLFVGGYPQTIFQPLVGTLLIALAASYVISITAVPLLSMKILTMEYTWLMKSEEFFHKISAVVNDALRDFFLGAVTKALEKKRVAIAYFVLLIALFVISVKGVMPIVGQELMPAMDTGTVKINITTDPNLPIAKSEELLQQINTILYKSEHIQRVSASAGSEAGILSIGSGSGIDHISVTANYVNRFERKETIWEIEAKLREDLATLPNIKYMLVFDSGASAMSSIRGNIDIMLSSDDFDKLQEAGEMVEKVIYNTQGIVSLAKTWDKDKKVYTYSIDEKLAAQYGVSSAEISSSLQLLLRGAKVSYFPLQNAQDFSVRVWFKDFDSIESLNAVLIDTPKGKVPLKTFVTLGEVYEPNVITRENLQYTLDVYGFREKAAISHIMANYDEASKDMVLPKGVELTRLGDEAQFKNSAGKMVKAIGFAVVLIFFTLIPMFNSVKTSILIIVSIPLTIIGAAWIMLMLNYHTSMPAMMGFMLLSGIIVNNAILLIHFALERIDLGTSPIEAMKESIMIRTRPVLMTALSVSAGMIPVAFGWAIGLERLAPLGAVAIGGLIVGTFLTLVFIPIVFVWIYKGKKVKPA
ncbi:MAG TPA: efflux RND transporter permease subunit [Campylobacterales bacterium]|nr:efflux RND transporter permease subunit [Campylobacterales bacterium]